MVPENQEVSLDEIRTIYRLVNACREHWADRLAWQDCLVEGIRELMDTDVSMLKLLHPEFVEDRPHMISLHSKGWESPEAKAIYLESLKPTCEVQLPNFSRVVGQALETGAAAFSRRMVLRDEEWYGTPYYEQYHAPTGCDEFVFSLKHSEALGCFAAIGGHYAHGADPVPMKAVRQLALLAEELIPLMGTELTMEGQIGVEGLSRRQRETLVHLLDGLSEKQVASKLGISPPTVHDYVVQLHRHFDVSSRGELLSYFVRRRPKAKAQRR